MTIKTAIKRLMSNDHNGTWDECSTMIELSESLVEAMSGYEPTEQTYIFYKRILNSL